MKYMYALYLFIQIHKFYFKSYFLQRFICKDTFIFACKFIYLFEESENLDHPDNLGWMKIRRLKG